jgi:hypothetical protein
LLEELHIWRLIEAGMATLYELETCWSMDDVIRANTVLDVKNEVERLTIEESRKHD